MKMEQTECSETSAYKIETPGNYPKENTRYVDCLTTLLSLLQLTRLMGNDKDLFTKDEWVKFLEELNVDLYYST